MNQIKLANLIWTIAFVVLLPISIFGQQSILLQPDEQVQIMPMNFPTGASSSSPDGSDSSSVAPTPAVTVPLPPFVPFTPLHNSQNAVKNLLTTIKPSHNGTAMVLNLIVIGPTPRFETHSLQNPARLVIDLFGVSIKKTLKKLQHFKLGTIRVGTHADKTRVVVDFISQSTPNYRILPYQLGLQINLGSISLSPALFLSSNERGNPLSQLPDVVKKPKNLKSLLPQKLISVDFRDADVRNVLRFMAKANGRNITFGNDVTGQVSIQLKNVPWTDALHAILQVANLNYTQSGGIIRVFTAGASDKERGFKCQVVCDQAH